MISPPCLFVQVKRIVVLVHTTTRLIAIDSFPVELVFLFGLHTRTPTDRNKTTTVVHAPMA